MNITDLAIGFFNSFLNVFSYIVILSVFGLMYYIYWKYKNYNYDVILREKLNDNDVIIHKTKGRLIRDIKNSEFKLMGKFRNVFSPIPPDASVQFTKKGRYFIEGYLVNKDTIVWAKDTKKEINLLDPVEQSQRNMLLHQIVKGEREKGKQLMQYLPVIIGLGFILSLFVLTVVFWEDITNPSVKAIQMSNTVLDRINELLITYNTMRTNTTVTITPTTTLKQFNAGGAGQ